MNKTKMNLENLLLYGFVGLVVLRLVQREVITAVMKNLS